MPRFVKGQSGNPGGRPKQDDELRELAKAQTAEALKTLAQVMRSKKSPAAARVMAANSILDRGYGKPAQQIGLSGEVAITMADLVLGSMAKSGG
jgi:hypothetical protein